MNIPALEQFIEERGAENIPLCMLTVTNNSGGGQPVSMENIRQTREVCDRHGIPLFIDACRFAENAWFIKLREKGYQDKPVIDIVREMFSYADGCTMSAKKDGLANIGGWLAMNNEEWAVQCRNRLILTEGFSTYGGLAGRDLEAMAIGIRESVSYEHMHARIGQVQYLGEQIAHEGVPIVRPVGGHGIFLDALKFLPQMPREQLPAQALAAALYVDSGVRAMERGAVSAGRDPQTGENRIPRLELVRLTIPRRVYTQAHMDVTAESVIDLYEQRDRIVGLRFTYEPKSLRFFQARFAPVEGDTVLRR
jgi:tryptophanase